jgi:hypothetical protein
VKKGFVGAAAAVLVAATMASGTAHAGTYLLQYDGCSSSCLGANSSIGTVSVNTTAAGAIDFEIKLTNGALFNANGNAQHHAFVFDLQPGAVNTTGLTIGNFKTFNGANWVTTTDFAAAPGAGPFSDAPFGSLWTNAVNFVGAEHQGHTPSSLSFEVTDTGHNLVASMLAYGATFNDHKIAFAADVYANRNTGNVGATPEPSTWAMMFMGLFGTGALLRRQRPVAVAD